MARQQAEIRREEILRSAATVVARKGFARTRVADVAAELGISPGLVFYHFDSKERLLSEAFVLASDRELAAMEAVVAGPGSHTERLRNVIGLYQQVPVEPADLEVWSRNIDAWAEGRYTDEIREVVRRNDTRRRHGLTRLVTQGSRPASSSARTPRRRRCGSASCSTAWSWPPRSEARSHAAGPGSGPTSTPPTSSV